MMRFDLAGHRRRARTLMTDRCIIREPDSWIGETRTEGQIAWRHDDQIEIPCRVKIGENQQAGATTTEATIGDEKVQLVRLTVSLPIDICPLENQVVTILSARCDPALVGRRFDVVSPIVGSQITARRISCLEHR